ncbi:MAG: heteromeric transposase endonuclease subunit TnsA [Caldilineae bacterium]|nr:MAG: heteromeric transposase endonuclease subunit TnsA [Caldilineae bacterium]
MAKRKYATTPARIKKWLREGRGQGRGADYRPWLRIQDVPSRGLVHRIKGWKTGRVHHFLSQFEAHFFYALEWSPQVLDIREQFPLLPQEETLEIAQACGVRHPTDPCSQQQVVMTTDFLVTLRRDGRQLEQPYTLKTSAELDKKRVLEKLEIERRYWARRHLTLKIVTNAGIPSPLTRNLELLHGYYDLRDRLTIGEEQLRLLIATLNALMRAHSDRPLRDITALCDRQTGVEPGVSLTVVYHLLATRRWEVDIRQPINPAHPLPVPAGCNSPKEETPCN